MAQNLLQITLVIRDYDEAIEFYTKKLGFELIEDTVRSETKRWVRVSPPGSNGFCLLFGKAVGEEQMSRIGNQTGGRVFLFIHTDDFERDYQAYVQNGVKIIRDRSEEIFGKVAVFADLYGNLIDLIQPIDELV